MTADEAQGRRDAARVAARFVPYTEDRRDTVRVFRSKPKKWWGRRRYPEHLHIPDPQVKADVAIEHLRWAALFALEHRPDFISFGHDWWDYPSLNSYEADFADFRTRDALEDTCAGLHALDLFVDTLNEDRSYDPLLVFFEGNHDERFRRMFRYDRRLRHGVPGPRKFVKSAKRPILWSPLEAIVAVDGVHYSHYFVNPMTGKPIGGTAQNKLTKLKFSFTMGHQQVKETAEQYLGNNHVIRGLVAGAFYQHREDYKGPQGNRHWRGICYKHEVRDGNYDLMEVSLGYLSRKYGQGSPHVLADPQWRADEFAHEFDDGSPDDEE